MNNDVAAVRAHGHFVPLAGLEPALHVFGFWLAYPGVPVGFIQALRVFLGIDFGLETRHPVESFLLNAEVETAISLRLRRLVLKNASSNPNLCMTGLTPCGKIRNVPMRACMKVV